MLTATHSAPGARLIALEPDRTLPIARYRFSVRMQDALRLPEYAGALLRGQFGAALRHLSCTEAGPCSSCHRIRSCAFPALFESSAPPGQRDPRMAETPNPYVIEPPQMASRQVRRGELLVFHMVLIGSALAHRSLIVRAWQWAVQLGLERSRSVGVLESIEWVPQHGPALLVWTAATDRIAAHDAHVVIPRFQSTEQRVVITLRTPLRLQQRGCLLNAQQLKPGHLFAAIARRTSLLLHFHAARAYTAQMAGFLHNVDSLRDRKELEWWDWTRYSARQRCEMTLGGLLGRWTIEGDLTQWLPWLWIGGWLHAGKNSTFGLGRLELE